MGAAVPVHITKIWHRRSWCRPAFYGASEFEAYRSGKEVPSTQVWAMFSNKTCSKKPDTSSWLKH
jgi:hypothetical protein